MNPPRPIRSVLKTAWKELRRMSDKLIRALDTLSHITVVFLALYVGVATFGLGVA